MLSFFWVFVFLKEIINSAITHDLLFIFWLIFTQKKKKNNEKNKKQE